MSTTTVFFYSIRIDFLLHNLIFFLQFTVENNNSSKHIFSHNPWLFTILYCWHI